MLSPVFSINLSTFSNLLKKKMLIHLIIAWYKQKTLQEVFIK